MHALFCFADESEDYNLETIIHMWKLLFLCFATLFHRLRNKSLASIVIKCIIKQQNKLEVSSIVVKPFGTLLTINILLQCDKNEINTKHRYRNFNELLRCYRAMAKSQKSSYFLRYDSKLKHTYLFRSCLWDKARLLHQQILPNKFSFGWTGA